MIMSATGKIMNGLHLSGLISLSDVFSPFHGEDADVSPARGGIDMTRATVRMGNPVRALRIPVIKYDFYRPALVPPPIKGTLSS